ncbi:MAG: lysine--tRNA ligase [Nanoarchaeota archaeon]|nr:lysine--tRNA ligase [Nanoarchaeota archaeon]
MEEKNEVVHWADQAAEKIINEKGNKKSYTVATGVTPSGTLHIGNFREFITGYFVNRALIDRGKEVRFLHYWDDYDVFRKVPVNMPKKEILESNLRKTLISVPDVFGCHKNYPEHNEKQVEKFLPIIGVNPKIIRQSEKYQKCEYAEEIKVALENKDKIADIFNKYREEKLKRSWLPISVYCEKCDLEAEKIEYLGNYKIKYECICGNKDEIDFRKKGLVKLKWRVQVPAWWINEKVDFEGAGKDHFAAGGTFDTAREITREVYGTEPPVGFGFGWISIKGGRQFSSSTGVIITLKEMLEIYEPNLIRWLFAGSRPATEFAVSFDLDVLKLYEDFDRCERIYFKKEKIEEKEYLKQKRIYELSAVKIPKKLPFQPSFRHLTNVIQIYQNEWDKVKDYYKKELKTKEDEERLELRFRCASNWIEKYAPDDFKFKLQDEASDEAKKQLDKNQVNALKDVAERLKKKKFTEKSLFEEFYSIVKENKLEVKDFFKAAYLVLINKERGPRLASFILAIGEEKVIGLFEKL